MKCQSNRLSAIGVAWKWGDGDIDSSAASFINRRADGVRDILIVFF